MTTESLTARRRWFRFFPEGTIEFTIITRVLALLVCMGLAVAPGAQRPLVLMLLTTVLWFDYAILLWWVLQMGCDLEDLTREPTAAWETISHRRVRLLLIAVLPSIAAAVLIAPWPAAISYFTGSPRSGIALAKVVLPLAGVVFIVFWVLAQRGLQAIRLGPPLWTGLLLVPVVHFFALHRLAARLEVRVRDRRRERGDTQDDASTAAPVLAVADVIGLLTLLPWGILLAVSLLRGWPAGGVLKLTPVCGTGLAAVFAIINLAALESVQRQFVALIRKL